MSSPENRSETSPDAAPEDALPPLLAVARDGSVHLGADVRALLLDIDGVLSDHRTAADAAVYSWASTLPGWTLGSAGTADLWERLDRKHFLRYQQGELTFNGQLLARVRDFVPGAAPSTMTLPRRTSTTTTPTTAPASSPTRTSPASSRGCATPSPAAPPRGSGSPSPT